MKKMHRRAFVVGGLSAWMRSMGLALAKESCPGVDAKTGTRPALSEPAVQPTLPEARAIPAAWRKTALELIALFEAGSRDVDAAYGNVSDTDVILLGFLQWNHNAGSLYSRLFHNADEAMIEAAPKLIRADIRKLVEVADGRRPKKEALKILDSWKSGGAVKTKVRIALSTWLTSKPMKARQDQFLDERLTSALRYADAWWHDFGVPDPGDRSQRAFYSFVDLQVFNGDLAGLWVDHVKTFRAQFKNGVEMMDHISAWTDDCVAFKFEGKVEASEPCTPKYRTLYRSKETPLSVKEWRRLVSTADPRINEDALNLLALGFLRATISNGNDRPRGFFGVFELDVLNRRGMMATGVGVLSGETKVTELFTI